MKKGQKPVYYACCKHCLAVGCKDNDNHGYPCQTPSCGQIPVVKGAIKGGKKNAKPGANK